MERKKEEKKQEERDVYKRQRDRSIIIPSETLKPINLTGIKIENNEIKADMRITLKDAMQYAYDILIQYGNSLKPAA